MSTRRRKEERALLNQRELDLLKVLTPVLEGLRTQAKAARLPRITLVANLTSLSSELFVLQSRDNPVFSAGAALVQPIFLGGLLQSQVDARTAEPVKMLISEKI